MKLTNKEQIAETASKVISDLKALWSHRPNRVKPIKKNTWRRKLKALDLKLDRRQQEGTTRTVSDTTSRICFNCGQEYTGRFCPQCGQAGSWSRFSWRQAFLNLLDIWGLGSRPIFRTIRDLFWRPGYMVRDYLNGHRQYYFPPFKLLAVTLVILLFVTFLIKKALVLIGGSGVNLGDLGLDSVFQPILSLIEKHQISGPMAVFTDTIVWILKVLSQSLLYEWLFIAVFLVLCLWIAFRRVGTYNFVETYIFFVFLLCQQWILLIVQTLGIGICRVFELPALVTGAIQPTSFFGIVASVFGVIAILVSTVFYIYRCYLFFLDFRQFYGLNWKSTFWHLFLAALVAFWVFFFGMLLALCLTQENASDYLLALFIVILIPSAFIYASYYLRKNKAQVNQVVSWICKLSMLSVFGGVALYKNLDNANYTILSVAVLLLLYLVAAVALSLMPVVVYKKYHRTWLAFLPSLMLVGMIMLFRLIK